jgi:hypothetical protein
MESEQLARLAAELKAQLRLIERVYERLQSRVEMGLDTPAQLDSVAYQVHNLYCAAEDLLKLVAKAFENSVTGSDWHRVLLLRLSQPVQGLRPALLSEATFDVMNRLRGFRHFVRHGYGAEIEVTQLNINLALAQQLQVLLPQDVESFLMNL